MKTKSTPPAETQLGKAGIDSGCVMQSGGINVLRVKMSPDAKCAVKDGSLHITAPKFEIEIWSARDSHTLDETVEVVKKQIVEEFTDFKANQTTDLSVAGSPAKRLVGAGFEADDGDPGRADVIVFRVGDRLFVACTHGESLNPIAQQGLLTVVRSAEKP